LNALQPASSDAVCPKMRCSPANGRQLRPLDVRFTCGSRPPRSEARSVPAKAVNGLAPRRRRRHATSVKIVDTRQPAIDRQFAISGKMPAGDLPERDGFYFRSKLQGRPKRRYFVSGHWNNKDDPASRRRFAAARRAATMATAPRRRNF